MSSASLQKGGEPRPDFLARFLAAVPLLAIRRRVSPIAIVGTSMAFAIRDACVPLPAPGAPRSKMFRDSRGGLGLGCGGKRLSRASEGVSIARMSCKPGAGLRCPCTEEGGAEAQAKTGAR